MMGETRQKKPTKKSLRAQQTANVPVSDLSSELGGLEISPDTNSSFGASPCSGSQSSLPNSSLLVSSSNLDLETFASSGDRNLVHVISAGLKGLGVFARQKISAGTLVLAERPLIRLTSDDEERDRREDSMLEDMYKSLSRSTRKDYLALHDTNKPKYSRVKSIYYSNCYNLQRYTGGGSCIGLTASRINHSCVPNVQFSFADNLPHGFRTFDDSKTEDSEGSTSSSTCSSTTKNGYMVFFAVKDIAKGKELFSNYSDSDYLVFSDRQNAMLMHYKFLCTCQSCSQNEYWAKSDTRRYEMIEHKKNAQQSEKAWCNARKTCYSQLRLQYERSTTKKDWNEQEDELAALSKEEKATSPALVSDAWMQHPKAKAEARFAIENLEKLLSLLLKEGLTGLRLCAVYRSLAKWSFRAGDTDKASKWTDKEKETCIMCFGVWSDRVREIDARDEKWWKA